MNDSIQLARITIHALASFEEAAFFSCALFLLSRIRRNTFINNMNVVVQTMDHLPSMDRRGDSTFTTDIRVDCTFWRISSSEGLKAVTNDHFDAGSKWSATGSLLTPKGGMRNHCVKSGLTCNKKTERS